MYVLFGVHGSRDKLNKFAIRGSHASAIVCSAENVSDGIPFTGLNVSLHSKIDLLVVMFHANS